MSAPDTNVEKQARRHKGPIVGISLGLIAAIVLFVVFLGDSWAPAADDPEDAAAVAVDQ